MRSTSTGPGKVIAVLLQSVIVQALGLVFFYMLSVRMSTTDFGLLSWANAVSVFLTTVIGFGLEQIVARRIAAGNATSSWAATAFFLHSLICSAIVLIILLVLSAMLGTHHSGIAVLPLLFLAQCGVLLVMPLKILLNARSRFMPYALIALASNAGKILAVLYMLRQGQAFSVTIAGAILLLSGAAEVVATAIYIKAAGFQFPTRVPSRGYIRLLHEASPQYLSVLFDISLARADWILLGILSTDAATGRYAFAYRAFEMLRIPALAVSLLLMPRLAQMLSKADRLEAAAMSKVQQFFRLEVWGVSAVTLAMAVLWVPVIGRVTNNHYGIINESEALLLALCLPMHYSISLMWMLSFNARKYRPLARITLITSLVNLTLNAVLIPSLGGMGAAIAFLTASAFQTALYFRLLGRSGMHLSPVPLLGSLSIVLVCYFIPRLFYSNHAALHFGIISLFAYLLVSFLFRQWRLRDITFIRQSLGA